MSKKKFLKCQNCGYETEVYEGRGFMGQHFFYSLLFLTNRT